MQREKNWFRKVVVLIFFFATAGVASKPASALSRRGAQAARAIERTLRNNPRRLDLFDGKRFAAGASMDRVKVYLRITVGNLARAIRRMRRISPADRADPTVEALRVKLNARVAYVQAMERALKNRKSADKRVQARCVAFRKRFDTGDNGKLMEIWISWVRRGAGRFSDAAELLKYKALMAKINRACGGEFKDVARAECSKGWHSAPVKKPNWWCRAAAKWKPLSRAAVTNSIKWYAKTMGLAALWSHDPALTWGYLPVKRPFSYREDLYLNAADIKEFTKRFKPMFRAAGMAWSTDGSLWAGVKAVKDKRRALVDAKAPTWRTPKSFSQRHYSLRIVRKQIKRMHPRARVRTAFLNDKRWIIDKNRFGVPQWRRMGGYVIYKVRGEPWCQLRKFTIAEVYRGGGRFKRKGNVRVGYVRFQKRCR